MDPSRYIEATLNLKKTLEVLTELLEAAPSLEGKHILLFTPDSPLLDAVGYEINIKATPSD